MPQSEGMAAATADTARFLTILAESEPVTFQTFDDRAEKRRELARTLHGTLEEQLPRLADLNRQGAGVFVTVNQTDLKGRTASNITAVRALFVDLDGAPLEPVLACGLEPHLIVETSPGRWHCTWLVADCALTDFTWLQEALAAKFGGDPSVKDLPRVMRLPGFYHRKSAPFLSRIIKAMPAQAYQLQEVINTLALHKPQQRARKHNGNGAHGTTIAAGGRNHQLASLAGSMRRRGMGLEAIEAALQAENSARCDPPLDEEEVSSIARSVARYEPSAEPEVNGSEIPPWLDSGHAGLADNAPSKRADLISITLGDFMQAEEAIEFLIDEVLRRGWFYSLTGPTGHGKTGVAVPLALDVADGRGFCGHDCDAGPVLYVASENPDDVRARFRVALATKKWSLDVLDNVSIVDQSFVLAERLPSLAAIVEMRQAVLIIVDTDQAIAMTSADDENSNAGRLEHAKRLRTLTKCSSRPTVVDLCHPIKHVMSVDGCVPRGGGAFLNEVDGNFRLWRNGDLVELTSDPNKFRGQPVAITFRCQMMTAEKLKDTKGRLIPFPFFSHVADSDAAAFGRQQWSDGNRLLDAMLALPDASWAEWAKTCQWLDEDGSPLRWKVQRLLGQLEKDDPPLVKRRRGGRWSLTPAGEKEAKNLK